MKMKAIAQKTKANTAQKNNPNNSPKRKKIKTAMISLELRSQRLSGLRFLRLILSMSIWALCMGVNQNRAGPYT